jgi:hypothetical protein
MKDEWSDWKEAWNAGARSLPEIQAQAEKQRRRLIFGIVALWAICIGLIVGAVIPLFHLRNGFQLYSSVVQLVFVATMLTFTHVAMWGNWREANETPDAQLALMERRWLARRRLTLFVQWGGLVLCTFVAGGGVAVWRDTQAPIGFLAGEIGFSAAMAVFFRFVSIRMRKKMDAALADLAEQRRLLRESDPGE